MKIMNYRSLFARVLAVVGGIAMLIGAVDPLEGSVIILAGSGLVVLGTWLGNSDRGLLKYWIGILGMIGFGVGAMFVLSAVGGIGGRSGHSMWWGVSILPYPIGWIMGIVSLLFTFVRSVRHQHAAA